MNISHTPLLALAAITAACTSLAVPATAAGSPSCDSALCVPYVVHNAAAGKPCPFHSSYVFGLDSAGNTLECASVAQWFPTSPLIGVRLLSEPCARTSTRAQGPDGAPLACDGRSWVDNFGELYIHIPQLTY